MINTLPFFSTAISKCLLHNLFINLIAALNWNFMQGNKMDGNMIDGGGGGGGGPYNGPQSPVDLKPETSSLLSG